MRKLKPSFRNVLSHLVERPSEYVLANRLSDGNGRDGCARGEVLNEMRRAGLIEYGRAPSHSLSGYRITDAGRAALLDQP